MTKCEQLRLRVDLIEAAMRAALQAERRAIRFDEHFVDKGDDPDWLDDAWLDAHRNEAGKERLDITKEIIKQIEGLL